MTDLSQVQIDFTYRDIIKWDLATTKKNYADPNMRPLIEEVIRRHKEAQAPATPVAATPDPAKAEALKKEAERLEALAAEQKRLQNLTPAQQEAEMVQRAADQKLREQQSDKEKVRAQVEAQRLADYLACTGETFPTAKERNAEVARRLKEHEDKIAAAEATAEAERVAAETAATEKAAAEAKAAEDAKVAAATAEAERVAAEAAVEAAKKADEEKARLAAEEAAKPPKKIVREYQVRDKVTGKPIGKPTRLVADTWEEMSQKQEEAHAEAVRYAERMKERASKSVVPDVVPQAPKVLSTDERAAAEKDLESKDETKKTLAQIKIEKDNLDRDKYNTWLDTENQRQINETDKFFKARPDFFPCVANANVLQEYLKKHGKIWNAANLEEAFEVMQSKMAEDPNAPTVVPAVDAAAEAAKAAAAVEAAKKADEVAAKVQAEATAKAAADAETQKVLEARIRAEVLAEIEAKKKLEQEQAAGNTAAAQASVAPAAPAAGSTSVEKTATAANPAAPAPKPPTGGIEPGSMHGGRVQSTPTSGTGSKTFAYTKQDIKRMPPEEMKKKMRDPKFVRFVNELFAPQK